MTDTKIPALDVRMLQHASRGNIAEHMAIKYQAPRMTASMATNLGEQLHQGPNPMASRRTTRVGPGDAAPDFTLESTAGGSLSLADLRGRPTVLHLARAMRTGLFCPISTGSMDEYRAELGSFRDADVQLVVVAATHVDEARGMVDAWELPYPLYADPELALFDAYDVGYLAGPPLHGWVVIDADGIVRRVDRTRDRRDGNAAAPGPSAVELLEAASSTAA